MNHNKLSIKQGSIILNGQKVNCVTDFKCEFLKSGIVSVTICFDVPFKETELTAGSMPETRSIDIPVSVNGVIIDHIKVEAQS